MPVWDETLQVASFDGVEFPLASRTIGGGRALSRRRYPNRPGQSIEDMGREPYTFELEIPLFAGVNPDHYPGAFEALRAAFDHPQTGGLAEYIDPELGPIQAQIADWSWLSAAKARDGGVLTVRLEEVSFDDLVLATSTQAPLDAGDQAAALDEQLEALGVSEADLEASFTSAGAPLNEDERDYASGALWTKQAEVFAESLEDGVQAAETLATKVDTIRQRLDVVLGLDALQAPEAVHAHHAAVRLAASLTALAETAMRERPPLVEHTLRATRSVYEVAVDLYGTSERADEIIQRNPSPDPLFLPAGTVLVVLAA